MKWKSFSTQALVTAICAITVIYIFLFLQPNTDQPGGYSVTEQGVYFFDQLMYDVDVQSFEALPYDYGRDKNFVYYDGRVIDGADPATFTVLGYLMAKDARAVYVYDRAEPLLDPTRVQFLGNYYTQQGSEIHYKGRPTEIDTTTFELIPHNLGARDKNGMYIAGKLRTNTPGNSDTE